jgi:hypothetical protein
VVTVVAVAVVKVGQESHSSGHAVLYSAMAIGSTSTPAIEQNKVPKTQTAALSGDPLQVGVVVVVSEVAVVVVVVVVPVTVVSVTDEPVFVVVSVTVVADVTVDVV